MRILAIILFLLTAARGQNAAELAGHGRYAEAASAFLTEAGREKTNPPELLKARLNAASCMKLAGNISAATRLLSESVPLLDQVPGVRVQAYFMSEYGSVLSLGRKPGLALPVLGRAALLAEKAGDRSLLAEIRNDHGIALAASGNPDQAIIEFSSALDLASASLSDLASRVRQNRLLAAYAIWKRERDAVEFALETQPLAANDTKLKESRARFETLLTESISATSISDLTPAQLFEAVSAGVAAVRYGREEDGFRLLERALEKSRAAGRPEIERAALLSLGEMYLDHGRRDDALLLLAALRADPPNDSPLQQAAMETLLARAEMLPGGDAERARRHVDRAVALTGDLRGDLATSQTISDLGRPFRESAGLPYLIRADLDTHDGSPAALTSARQAIESYKAWELDDFYRDDCVNLARAQATDLADAIPPGVAVLYVIPLPDRTEILVGTHAGTRRFRADVPEEILTAKSRLLRHQLEYERGFPSYIPTAGFLHEALIAPIRAHLRENGIRHLVFIPEGPFAALPMAALRDPASGRFLIEDFSLSLSPGLLLLPAAPEENRQSTVLLAGVSDGVQGFLPLPGVRPELAEISKIYGGRAPLLDSDFSSTTLSAGLIESQATIIHIASHAEFSSDPDGTFLLTHEGKITMDDLERMIRPRKFTGRPVELLCLSACRTAAGDDRAALGLAGIAIKSGARSVVASLWQVDDSAASKLMVRFHRNLHGGALSKAESLRQAQLEMLRSDPYIHPYLWAPFILIGDWRK